MAGKAVNDKIDYAVQLIEILEIETTNSLFQEFKQKVYVDLKKLLETVNNPDWLINLLLEVRKRKS